MANVSPQLYNPLDPTSLVDAQRLARRQALADALRAQSQTPIDYDPKGKISWLQLLGKGLQTVGASYAQGKADTDTLKLATQRQQQLAALFGGQQGGGQPSPQGAPIPGAALPGGDLPVGQGTDGAPMTPLPQQGQQSPPQAPPQQAGPPPSQRGPLSLSGDPAQDYSAYALNPDKYTEAVIASHAPTDFAKSLLSVGIDPNSQQGRALILQNVNKQNYIAPVNGRPGSTLRDPNDPSKVIGYDAPNVEGALPVYDDKGFPQGYRQAPGYSDAVAAAERAKALGKGDATPMTAFGPDGQPVFTTPSAVARGVNGGGQGSSGPLGAIYGGGGRGGNLTPQPSPGFAAASTEVGKQSAGAFSSLHDAAAASQDRVYQLGQIGKLLNTGTSFGAGSADLAHTYGVLSTIGQTFGLAPIAPDRQRDTAEFKKYVSNLMQRQASQLGQPTDAKLAAVVEGLPNTEIPNAAGRKIVEYLTGQEVALQAKANAAQTFATQNGPQNYPAFERAWRQSYDPELFIQRSKGPEAFAAWARTLPPPKRADLARRYRGLVDLGAFQ